MTPRDTSTPPLINVSNLAAFGVEWEEEGSRFQLANPRGTRTLLLGIKSSGHEWMTAPVEAPQRFLGGLTGPPRTFSEFRSVVQAWFDDAKETS